MPIKHSQFDSLPYKVHLCGAIRNKQVFLTYKACSSSPEKQTKQKWLKEDAVAHQRNKQNKND
jgi:hypothetical protein